MPLSKSSKFIKSFINCVNEAKEIPRAEIEKVDIVVYSTDSYPPAHSLYISLLHSGKRVILASAVEASVHILPYRENVNGIITFVYRKKDPSIINLAQVSSLLDIKLKVYGPSLHPAYEEKLESLGIERIEICSKSPLITLSMASLFWTYGLLPKARKDRLKNELDELGKALYWLEERYENELNELDELGKIDAVLYTFSTRSGAEYLRLLLNDISGYSPIILPFNEINVLRSESKVLTFMSSVEEHFYPSIRLEAQIKNIKQIVVKFNTDPLTASIYSMLFSSLVTGKIL